MLDKTPNMISVADGVMHLYGQRKQMTVLLHKGLSHSKNGEQMGSVTVNVEIERGKLHPGQHGYIKGVGRLAGLGKKRDRSAVLPDIVLISLQKCGVLRVEKGSKWRKNSRFSG